MGKIVHFRTDNDELVDWLENLIKDIKERKVDNIMIAAKESSGQIITGWKNLDWGTRQELISHMQIDVINTMIQENYVTPN